MSGQQLPAYQETLGLLGKLSARRPPAAVAIPPSPPPPKSAPRLITEVQADNGWNRLLGGLTPAEEAAAAAPSPAPPPPPPAPVASNVRSRFQQINWERRRSAPAAVQAEAFAGPPAPPTARHRFEAVNWSRSASWTRRPQPSPSPALPPQAPSKPTVQRFFAGIRW